MRDSALSQPRMTARQQVVVLILVWLLLFGGPGLGGSVAPRGRRLPLHRSRHAGSSRSHSPNVRTCLRESACSSRGARSSRKRRADILIRSAPSTCPRYGTPGAPTASVGLNDLQPRPAILDAANTSGERLLEKL